MKLDINNYPGSKNGSGVLKWLINHVPDTDIYHEMFGGSAVLSFELADKCLMKNFYVSEKYQPVYEQIESKRKDTWYIINMKVKFIDSVEFYLDAISGGQTFEKEFFYFDPPYLMDERKSKRNIYGCEWSMGDHKRMFKLIELLNDQGALIMVSHYDSRIYNDNFAAWQKSKIKTRTRAHTVEETIWMNYDISQMKLACIDYIGKNFTDRQRIKRKQNNILDKLKSLPIHEQQAIVDRIYKEIGK